MSAIAEKQLVRAPLGAASRLLQASFAAHRGGEDDAARIVLRAGRLEHPAIVALRPAPRPADMTPHFRVHWEADGGGPYPVFDGELTVGGDEDYDAFWLVLDGAYSPPGGWAGRLFNSAIGRRVADTTARELLRELCDEVEAAFADEELAKRPSEPAG